MVSLKSLPARVVLIGALICAALSGCTSAQTKLHNEICDSELQSPAHCWTLGGTTTVRHGLGPDDSNIIYYAGTGRPSGFVNYASFLGRVQPGRTYRFSAYVDGSGQIDVPPYVFLSAANGSWTGTSFTQAGKGRASITFSIPADSETTIIRGTFATENGTYPIGRGAIFAQPNLATSTGEEYAPSDDDVWTTGPDGGNLIAGSEPSARSHAWIMYGPVRAIARAGPDGSAAVVYAGTGLASGFGVGAAVDARVNPGVTYTFSAYLDGSAHEGTPPYVILSPIDGKWRGASIYQPARGRVFVTFTIPSDSGTTHVRMTFSTENGAYPRGSNALFAEPQLERGAFPHAYAVARS